MAEERPAGDRMNMPTTWWTVIAQARQRGSAFLETLLARYRLPIARFVRQSGVPPQDVEDVVQDVFLVLVKDDVIAKADRARGRFRSLVLAVTRHLISVQRRHGKRLKRGGGVRTQSLDVPAVLENCVKSEETDTSFDAAWVENLVRLGMNQLRDECEREGKPFFQALFFVTNDELSYEEIARRLDASLSDVKNYVHQARLKLKRYVLKEIEGYSSSREEYESERSYLMRLLE